MMDLDTKFHVYLFNNFRLAGGCDFACVYSLSLGKEQTKNVAYILHWCRRRSGGGIFIDSNLDGNMEDVNILGSPDHTN